MSKQLERVRAAAQELATGMAAVRGWAHAARADAEARGEQRVAAVQAEAERALAPIRAGHARTVQDAAADFARIAELGLPVARWDAAAWDGWAPQAAPPPVVRLGVLESSGNYHTLRAPALVPFVDGRNLVLKAEGEARDTAVRGVQALALRLLALVPPGKLRMLLIDPVGLGENVALFMNLKRHGAELIGDKAWVERADIERKLADLSAHMENVIQGFLRGRFATMEDFNAEAGEVAEPYRLLVVMNFPANFSEDAARRLVSIARNGPRCGVYTLVVHDTAQQPPHGVDVADLDRAAHVLIGRPDGTFTWNDDHYAGCRVRLDAPPPVALFESLLDRVGRAAREGSVVETPFTRLAPPPDRWWTGDATDELAVAVGRKGAREDQTFALGVGTAQHALIAGKTGSGKSNLLHVLITNLALTYSPHELTLYLVDFKEGVEFKPYADHALPHARVIAIESEREFGLSVLRGLDDELKRRGGAFRGASASNLSEYREKARAGDAGAPPMPRILLIVDEFQWFFNEDDALGREAGMLLDRLARQGRAFGMHVLLGSQTLAGTYTLSRSTLDQMAVRVALQCTDADSQLILARDNPAARLLSRAGDSIYNASNGLKEGNERFQVAWLDDPAQDAYLRALRDRADREGFAAHRPVVFEGNAPARLGEGSEHPLARALAADAYPPPSPRVHAWLGDPVALRPPTAATFFRRAGRNLLVVGREEAQGLALLSASVVALAAQHAPGRVRFLLADYGMDALDGPGFARPLAQALPHETEVLGARALPEALAALAALVAARLEAPDGGPAVYLALGGLQRARALRREEGSYRRGDAPPSAADLLLTVLRDGPDVGVHVLAWTDTTASLAAVLDRKGTAEFGMRIALAMPDKESSELLGSPAASRLKPFRALFLDEEQPGALETFRPYERPAPEWLDEVGARLRTRQEES